MPVQIKNTNLNKVNIARGREVFINRDLQNLWDMALCEDPVFEKIIQAVHDGERVWPKDVKIRTEGSEEAKPIKATISIFSQSG